jgi:uncharacterized membrane protein
MQNMSGGKTALGLDANVGAMLCYLPICAINLIYSIIVLVTEKDNRAVRFHAFQSLLLMAAIFVIMVVLGIFGFIIGVVLRSFVVSMLFSLLTWGLLFVFIVVAVYMCVKAYKGSQTKLPVIGDMADKWA